MLTMIKVSVSAQLAQIPAVMDFASRGDADFPARAQQWLGNAEQMLGRLRRSEVALLAMLKGKLLSALEGQRDPQVSLALSSRKAIRAAATIYLAQAESELREVLGKVEDQLQPMRHQLAQLVSAGSLLGMIGNPASAHNREAYLQTVWLRLSEAEQTRGMATYLRTSLASIDRLYLLDELLCNLHGQ